MSDSIVLANRIKRTAESSTDGLREIFNNESRNAPGASSLTFKKLESSMCKRRRLELPKLPISPEEFVELLIDSPFSSNHRLTIRDGNDTAILFATDLMISKLLETDTIHFDGTFKVVPHIFYQLFTIFIQYKGHAIPALHILMTSKSENLYTAVLSSLHQYIPDFSPLMAICDFEKAPRNSFMKIFPHILLVGCWFHYTKALHDKIKKLGLSKLYLTNKAFKKWVHQLMALPFLTEEEIHPTFVGIHLELLGLTDLELELVSSFKMYFIKQWIDGSQGLSIFYNEVTTNNGAESYHNTLKTYIKTNHPNTWKFMSAMDKILSDYDLEVKRLDDGLEITRLPKLKSRKMLNSEQTTKQSI